jgi:hypothetical protein
MVLELQVQPRKVCFSPRVGVVHLEIVKYNRMVLELQVKPRRVCFSQGVGVKNLEIVLFNKMVLKISLLLEARRKVSFSEFPVGYTDI